VTYYIYYIYMCVYEELIKCVKGQNRTRNVYTNEDLLQGDCVYIQFIYS